MTNIIGVIIVNIFIAFITSLLIPKRQKKILEGISGIDKEVGMIREKLDKIPIIDSRDLKEYLRKIPWNVDKESNLQKIEKWYSKREINIDLKSALEVVVSHYKEIGLDIEEFQQRGDSELSNTLTKVKEFYIKGEATNMVNTAILDYQERKEKNVIAEIEILQNTGKYAESLFAWKEAERVYKKTIDIYMR